MTLHSEWETLENKPDICFQQAQWEFPVPTTALEKPQWLSHRLIGQAEMSSLWPVFLKAVDARPDVVKVSVIRICLCNATFDIEFVGRSVPVLKVAVANFQSYVAFRLPYPSERDVYLSAMCRLEAI